MAGDWMGIDHELPEKPEVLGIFERTGIPIDTIVGRLFMLWRLADRQTTDGLIRFAGPDALSQRCGGDAAFWLAVADVGWLVFGRNGAQIPDFPRRFGRSARRRMLEALRKQVGRMSVSTADAMRTPCAGFAPSESESESESEPQPEPQPEPESQPESESDACVAAPRSCPERARGKASVTLENIMGAWNAIGPVHGSGLPGLEPCRVPTTKRKASLKQRLSDPFWCERWREALECLSRSTFAQGGGDKGWRASLDWFLRPDTVARTLEGRYGERQVKHDPRGNLAVMESMFRKIDEEEAGNESG